ncbi:4-amino-4-deoxy-L-arabinose transferase-like glycosyltransferase [Paenibacillus shirakamiensis]|uniref:4-amino-4-deoxy-L-arabinose transferase-like glycosyltransferase n=1 Tax=Paenibacillus shirakamiensis TaxID=1265935 RepID=A0ABS4JIB8_9BACL|nr:glycosyltransferase family 39 protein [Paenibacillus shirakamiensis]MBP2001462.1 4-amino-4-deoxy-L-arabinose transferase-like glycosyltransferase [Paenibacillus shirakamiensis]
MFLVKDTTIKQRVWLAGIAFFILAMSSFTVLWGHNYFLLGSMSHPDNDDVKYIQSAKLLLTQGTLAYNSGVGPSAFVMPGFPVLLAGFIALFGDEGGVIAFRLFQCLLQALSIYLIFWIARYVFNEKVAMIACVLSALYVPDYFSSAMILSESICRILILLMVVCIIQAIESRRWTWYLMIAILTAVGVYFKPQLALVPLVLILLWWRHRFSIKIMIQLSALMVTVFLILLAPWWIRNVMVFDRFILFTSSAGSPFLLGTRMNWELPSSGFFQAYPQYTPKTIFEGSDDTAVTKGMDIIKYGFTYEPWKYLKGYTIEKFEDLYLDPYYWRPIWPISKAAMVIMQALIIILSTLGLIWALFKNSFTRMLPMLYVLAYFTVVYIPFVAFSRYGYNNMVFLLILAAYCIERSIHFVMGLSQRKRQGTMVIPR